MHTHTPTALAPAVGVLPINAIIDTARTCHPAEVIVRSFTARAIAAQHPTGSRERAAFTAVADYYTTTAHAGESR